VKYIIIYNFLQLLYIMTTDKIQINDVDNEIKYTDNFWFEDFSILYNQDRLTEFFPTMDMTFYEKMNSVFRLSILLFIILTITRKNIKTIFLPLLVATVSLYLFKYENEIPKDLSNILNKKIIDEEQDVCLLPTSENAFMNVMKTDYGNNKKGHVSCNVDSKIVKEKINKNFSEKIYKDVTDIYSKNGLDRQFYSNPNNLIPNDQKKFAMFLYGSDKTCKEDTTKCDRQIYEDTRRNAVNPQDIPRGSS